MRRILLFLLMPLALVPASAAWPGPGACALAQDGADMPTPEEAAAADAAAGESAPPSDAPAAPAAPAEPAPAPGADQPAPAVPQPQQPQPPAAEAPKAEQPSKPETPKAERPKEVRLQYDGITYNEVIRRFSQMMGKPIVGEYSVEGTLTFFDPQPYTFDEAFDTLNLLLAMRGFALVETERYLRVVAIKDVTKAPVKLLRDLDEVKDMRPGQIVTLLVPLKTISGEDAARVLQPVISSFGSAAPMGRGRGVILTDQVQNIQRIRGLLEELDAGELTTDRILKTYKLKHASARDIASIINTLFGSGLIGPGGQPRYIRNEQGQWVRNPALGERGGQGGGSDEAVKATPDERTNTLFLIGQGDKLAMAEQVIEQLDAIEPASTGDMRIFSLKNAKAEELANTLKELLPRESPAASAMRRGQPPISTQKEMETRVVADAATNRVIVTAPLDQMARIEDLIKELDQASTDVGGLRVFPLKVADAQQMSTVILGAIRRTGEAGRYPGRGRSTAPAVGANVTADSRTNSLVVSGTASDILVAETIIKELDRPLDAQTREIRVVQLKAGDARQLAQSLTRMLSQGETTGRYGSSQSASNIRVEAETATNSLLISAAPGDWPIVEKLLEELKANAEPMATATTRMIILKHARATEVADTLSQIYGGRSRGGYGGGGGRFRTVSTGQTEVPVVIAASERTNSLIISAADDDQKAIADLVAAMDVPGADGVAPVRVVSLKAGDAVKIADVLSAMQPPTQRGEKPAVFIQGDAASNLLVIRAPDEEFKAMEQTIAQLDRAMTESGGIKTFPLKVADAQQVATILQNALTRREPGGRRGMSSAAPQTIVSADTRTNTLIVAGPAGDIQQAETLIAELDKPMDKEAREIHVVQLKVGDARQLAYALQRMVSQEDPTGRRGISSPSAVRIEADSGTNSLMISAPPGDWASIQALLEELKTNALPLATPTTRLVPLKHAKASEVAESLNQVYGGRSRGAAGAGGGGRFRPATSGAPEVPVVITASDRTNSLLISAADDDQTAIAELITKMDVPATTPVEPMQMVRLKFADAARLTQTLKAMMPQPERGQPQTLFIEADTTSNAILLRGPEADRKTFEDLIATLDQATEQQGREVRLLPVKNVSAARLVQTLSQLYPASGGASPLPRFGRRGGGASSAEDVARVTLAASPDDKTLIVDAPKDKVEEIASLVASMDAGPGAGDALIRLVRLQSADATKLADALRAMVPRPERGGEPTIIIQAEPSANAVLIRGPEAERKVFEEMIASLDQATEQQARETRLLPLQHASAATLAQMVGQLYASAAPAMGRRYGSSVPSADEQRVVVTASPDDKTLVVDAPHDKVEAIASLAKSLDVPGAGGATALRMIRLQSADAVKLADTLRGMVPQPERGQAQQVFIQADPLANAVLLRGPEAERKMLEEMVASLDQATQAQAREMRQIPLKHASASMLAMMLGQLYPDPTRSFFSRRGGPAPSADDTQRVIIAAAPGDRALVIEAPRDKVEAIATLVATLDVEDGPGQVQVRTYQLANARAAEIAPSLVRLFAQEQRAAGRAASATTETQPRFESDAATNQLMVSATPAQFETIEQLIEKLEAGTALARETKTYRLKQAKAADLVPVLEQMLLDTPASPYGRRGAQPSTVDVRVAALPDTNDVIVQGPPDRLALAEQLIKTFDVEGAGGGPSGIVIVQLKNAMAASLAEAVNASLAAPARATARRGGPGAGATDQVTVTAETNANAVLVRGPSAEVPAVVEMIKALDAGSSASGTEVRVFPLKNAEPTVLATSLGRLFQDMIRQQGGRSRSQVVVPFAVAADERTGSLVVSTTPAYFALVETILQRLDDEPATPEADVQYVWLENADASEVASQLTGMYADRKGVDKPVITADTFSNAITVIARDADLKTMEPIIRKLDEAAKDSSYRVRVIPLSAVRAEKMAEVLRQVYAQMSGVDLKVTETGAKRGLAAPGAAPSSERPAPEKPPSEAPAPKAPAQPEAGQGGAATGRLFNAPAQEAPSITVDKGSNTLIISGKRQDLDYLEDLVSELSWGIDTEEPEFRSFHIEKADPVSVARTLDDLFNPKPRQQPQQQQQQRGGQQRPQQPAPIQLPPPNITVVADARTKSVIVRAKPADFDVIEPLIKQLDQVPTVISEVRVFPLKNTDATEVAANLKDIFQRAVQGRAVPQAVQRDKDGKPVPQPQQQQVEAVRQLLELKTTQGITQVELSNMIGVSANKQTNSVVVAAPTDSMEIVERLINELDATGQLAATSIRMYPVANADVPNVVKALREVFASSARSTTAGRTGARTVLDKDVIITGDEVGRLVIVSAPPDVHELVATVVKQLDDAQLAGEVTVKVYRLESADAASVAAALTATVSSSVGAAGRGAAPAGQLRISADRSSNAVIVRASADEHARIDALLKELDISPTDELAVRLIPLNNADAVQVAAVLNRVFGPGAQVGRRGGMAAAAASPARATVVIEADAASRMLAVRADDETFDAIRTLATQLDTASPASQAAPELITLKFAQAVGVAAAVGQAFQSPRGVRGPISPDDLVLVVAEPGSNSLIVTANEKNLDKVKALVAKLDTEDTGGVRTELVLLKHAKAVEVAPVLQRMIQTPGAGGGRGRGMATPGQPGVVVSADAGSNGLVISGPSGDLEKVLAMARDLDTATGESGQPVVKTYPVKNAEVRVVVQALENAFPSLRGRGGAPDPTAVTVTGDDAGGLVVVSAPQEKHALVAKVIEEIDAASGADAAVVKVYRLENADAAQVAAALQATVDKSAGAAATGRGGGGGTSGTGQIRISADRSSNALVVRAGEDGQTRIAALVKELDVLATDQYAVRLIPLNNADAVQVAAVLNRVFGAGAQVGRRGGMAAAASPARASVVIEADAASRMLAVRADDETFDAIRTLATQLDTASPASQAVPELITLKFAQAASVAAAVGQAFQAPRGVRTSIDPDDLVLVVAEPASNSLIVTANEKNKAKVRALVESLDSEATAGVRTEMLILQNAKAEDLAPVLTAITRTPPGGAGRGAAATVPITVAAEKGSNALVLSGPSGELDKVLKMARDLDTATSETGQSVRIIPLKNGDAVAVAAMVRELYAQQQQAALRERKTIDALAVSADARANAVILATSDAMFEQASLWINQIEVMQPERGSLKIITLQHADPAEVQRAIDDLFGTQPGGTGSGAAPIRRRGQRGAPGATGATRPGGKVETTVLPQQRSILINASDEDYEVIQKLAEALDAAAADAQVQFRVIALKSTSNVRIAAALTQLYRGAGPRAGATPRPEDVVTITALPDTNALVVSAAATKLAEVEHLIQQMDKEEIAPQLEFRIFPLENAQPTKVMPVLQQMLTQVQRMRPDEPLNVQADERTRSIIVTARGPMFDQVGQIIKTLDLKPAYAEADVLIIPLKNADATRLAAVLTDMLRPSAAAQVTPEARALQEQVRLLKVRSADGRVIPELDLTKPIKITADPMLANTQGANALVITSTPDNLKAMEALVGLLDAVPLAEGVRVRVAHLKHADAASVAIVLRDIFTQGQSLAGRPQTSTEGRAEPDSVSGRALVNPFNVSADPRTNSLVMSGVEESLALAGLIVADLDRDAGELVTEVRLFRLDHADVTRLVPVLQSVFGEATAVPGTEGLRTQVTRLRTVLEKEAGHATELPKTRAALTIQGDPTTSIVVVAARKDVMPLIADVIKTMDVAGAGSLNAVQLFPLINADATRLKAVLDSLYVGPNAQLVRAEDKPTVTVDTRTNTLVILASGKTFAVLQTLLKRLDTKIPIEMRDIRLVTLTSAEAATLAPTLQEMMDARVQRLATLGAADAEAVRVIIVADARSNSLIVGGSAEGYEIVKNLAQQLDGAAPALGGQIQILPLTNANAGSISTTLTSLFTQRYQAARTQEVARQRPIILADLRVNALLVAANADDSKVITGLLKQLDVKPTDPAVPLTLIPLAHNDSGIVGQMIQQLFAARLQSMKLPGQTPVPQDRVDVATDSLSNSLIISASKDNLALIQGLVEKLDVEPPTETGIVRMYPLLNSDAQRVATMLGGLVSQGLYKPGMATAGQDAQLAAREKVSIVADTRTNVLVVSASKENFAVIEQVIKTIDATADFGLLGDIRLFTLKNANATRLAPTLQQLFTAKRQAEIAAGGTGRMLPVSIVPDARTNTLLVTGSRESFNAIEAMIKELDTDQVLAANEFRVFYLEQATATVLQPTLQQLFAQRAARGGTNDPVTIVTEPRTNSLIVSATPEDMRLAESLIARLDSEPDRPGTAVQIFMLSKADATQVANTLTSLYKQPGAAAGAAPTVGISVDERTNAIVVSAGPSDLKRIKELVSQLDTDSVPRVTEIRVFTLDNADATELSSILNEALNNKPTPMTQASPNRQALLQFVTRSKEGGELISSALQEGVLITPDRRTNSIVVSAPVENMLLLESLIRAMDSTTPRTAEIRVFTLVNSDARAMSTVLLQLFKMQAAGAAAGQKQSIEYTLVPREGEADNAAAPIGSAQDAALTVTVDIRTNSLLVGGTKHYVELASKVIQELDQSTAADRLTEVYRLRNSQAADIEAALTNFLNQERQLLAESLGPAGAGTAQYILEREVAIVAEPTSNTLLLSASPRYFEVVAQMIRELDQPPPQVLIQVLLAEVTIDDTTEFGIEWNWLDVVNNHAVQVGTAPGFAASAGLTLHQGFSVSVTGGDVNFLLRAIESQGRLEVLSRPQILASDNQQATINVGQRVPFITNSRVTENGTTLNTIQYQQIGIILDVVPRINPDGFVKLEVRPEISSLSDSSVQISPGVNATIINNRSAETTVTVQDGHTIVVGGLITTTDRDRLNKVPFFGDIPLLGHLFRSTRKAKERTELLIILTPTVLRSVEAADHQTDDQIRRLNLLREKRDDPLKESLFKSMQERTTTYKPAEALPTEVIIKQGDAIPREKPTVSVEVKDKDEAAPKDKQP